jgi:hypothetical protein
MPVRTEYLRITGALALTIEDAEHDMNEGGSTESAHYSLTQSRRGSVGVGLEKVHVVRMSPSYSTLIGGFIVFLAVTLLTLLDVRRGFLFDVYPVRTLFYVFTPIHGLMLTSGLVGMIACYWGATIRESRLSDTSRYVKGLTFVIFALLAIDLFAYRGVPAARSLASGRINADWFQAFGVIGWRRPIAQARSPSCRTRRGAAI